MSRGISFVVSELPPHPAPNSRVPCPQNRFIPDLSCFWLPELFHSWLPLVPSSFCLLSSQAPLNSWAPRVALFEPQAPKLRLPMFSTPKFPTPHVPNSEGPSGWASHSFVLYCHAPDYQMPKLPTLLNFSWVSWTLLLSSTLSALQVHKYLVEYSFLAVSLYNGFGLIRGLCCRINSPSSCMDSDPK